MLRKRLEPRSLPDSRACAAINTLFGSDRPANGAPDDSGEEDDCAVCIGGLARGVPCAIARSTPGRSIVFECDAIAARTRTCGHRACSGGGGGGGDGGDGRGRGRGGKGGGKVVTAARGASRAWHVLSRACASIQRSASEGIYGRSFVNVLRDSAESIVVAVRMRWSEARRVPRALRTSRPLHEQDIPVSLALFVIGAIAVGIIVFLLTTRPPSSCRTASLRLHKRPTNCRRQRKSTQRRFLLRQHRLRTHLRLPQANRQPRRCRQRKRSPLR